MFTPANRGASRLVWALLLLSAPILLAPWNLHAQGGPDSKLDEFKELATSVEMVMVPMRDGVALATDVHYPKGKPGPFPVIFVKTPYNFNKLTANNVGFPLRPSSVATPTWCRTNGAATTRAGTGKFWVTRPATATIPSRG
ncbi:MAG: hypothetical protein KIT83_02855 [Bryobacterales bacterium]|nr:hypothetical protein [Bryobacterales bacterium]